MPAWPLFSKKKIISAGGTTDPYSSPAPTVHGQRRGGQNEGYICICIPDDCQTASDSQESKFQQID